MSLFNSSISQDSWEQMVADVANARRIVDSRYESLMSNCHASDCNAQEAVDAVCPRGQTVYSAAALENGGGI